MKITDDKISEMTRGMLSDESILFRIAACFFCMLICQLIVGAIGIIAMKLTDDPILGLKWNQLFSASGLFIVGTFISSYIACKDWKEHLTLNKPSFWFIALAVATTIMFLPLVNHLTYMNELMDLPDSLKSLEDWMRENEDKNAKITEDFLRVENFGGFLLNILILAIIPAIGEEMFFRGLVQKGLFKITRNIHIAIWCSAIIFSAIHIQFYGFIPRMLMGALFGYLLVWSNSIIVPMICHFVNNASIVCIYYLASDKVEALEGFGTNDYSIIFISVAVCSILCYAMYRRWKISLPFEL